MITSLDNKIVKQLTKLHQKKYRDNSFLILNEDVVKNARDNNYLETLVYCDCIPFEFERSIEVSREVLNKISKRDDVNYIGVGKYIKENNNYKNRVIILDRLQDPLNIGRIMEAALLFGFDSIVLSKDCADIYNEKCVNNCKGAIFKLNIFHNDIKEEIFNLRSRGFSIYATGLRNETKLMNEIMPDNKMAIILGNEGSGVDDQLMDMSDEVIKIDMVNIDSLNVAMAGSILMHHFSK